MLSLFYPPIYFGKTKRVHSHEKIKCISYRDRKTGMSFLEKHPRSFI